MALSLFIYNVVGRQTFRWACQILVLVRGGLNFSNILLMVTRRQPAFTVIAAKTLHVRYCNICITFFVLSKKRLVILQIIIVGH